MIQGRRKDLPSSVRHFDTQSNMITERVKRATGKFDFMFWGTGVKDFKEEQAVYRCTHQAISDTAFLKMQPGRRAEQP